MGYLFYGLVPSLDRAHRYCSVIHDSLLLQDGKRVCLKASNYITSHILRPYHPYHLFFSIPQCAQIFRPHINAYSPIQLPRSGFYYHPHHQHPSRLIYYCSLLLVLCIPPRAMLLHRLRSRRHTLRRRTNRANRVLGHQLNLAFWITSPSVCTLLLVWVVHRLAWQIRTWESLAWLAVPSVLAVFVDPD